MNLATVTAIGEELRDVLKGRRFGRIFPLSRFEIAVDFRLHDGLFLFISVEPAAPRIHLINRRMRDLEKASGNPSPFLLLLRKHLSGSELEQVDQIAGERALKLLFSGMSETGESRRNSLLVQLTGRSANLFLTDERGVIVDSMRENRGEGQEAGDIYAPPVRGEAEKGKERDSEAPKREVAESLSEQAEQGLSEKLDQYYLEKEAERRFRSLAGAARAKLRQEIGKREKLLTKLEDDLAGHGDADKWKRLGDLLLANVATARREGARVIVVDYFDEDVPEIAIEIDENDSLTEAAEKLFRRYTKARNAEAEVSSRIKAINDELEGLRHEESKLEAAIEARDEAYLLGLAGSSKPTANRGKRERQPQKYSGVRQFNSSDGFEILVGKKSIDNDYLTFRIAKSLDTWMHAADYPGSHVVIRNPNRKEVPQKTLLEAAQLAAFYSQGKSQPKAAVHYTQKKFVNKPRGAPPGLVSLASFKTLLVEPKVPEFKS